MTASMPWKVAAFACVLAAALPGCKDDPPPEGELLVTAMIGPEGGELVGAGVTLTVPPRAVTTEMLFELRTAAENLSAGTYRQRGSAFGLFPQGLELALPARLAFDGGSESPAVLFRQDGMVVAADGMSTYINELSVIANADAGLSLTNVVEPIFSPTPEGATTVLHDTAHFSLQVTETPRVNLVLTLYDFDDVHVQDLNGSSSDGDCGFSLNNVTGASLSAGCADGPLSAQLRVTSPTVSFDAVPSAAGKVSPAVPVSVIAGGTDLAHFLGFFAFDTTPCFDETCDQRGECAVDEMGNGGCVCEPGFAPEPADPFSCACVPQCEGRACGNDSCGGSCGGCSDTQTCADEMGVCVDNPDGTSTGSDTEDPTTGGADTTGDSSTSADPTQTGTGTGTGTSG